MDFITFSKKICKPKKLQDSSIGFPDPKPFPNDTVDMPFFFVGDDAFCLIENTKCMQKSYDHRVLTREERLLNHRVSRTSWVSENAFAVSEKF